MLLFHELQNDSGLLSTSQRQSGHAPDPILETTITLRTLQGTAKDPLRFNDLPQPLDRNMNTGRFPCGHYTTHSPSSWKPGCSVATGRRHRDCYVVGPAMATMGAILRGHWQNTAESSHRILCLSMHASSVRSSILFSAANRQIMPEARNEAR